jgi:hypothetical protein
MPIFARPGNTNTTITTPTQSTIWNIKQAGLLISFDSPNGRRSVSRSEFNRSFVYSLPLTIHEQDIVRSTRLPMYLAATQILQPGESFIPCPQPTTMLQLAQRLADTLYDPGTITIQDIIFSTKTFSSLDLATGHATITLNTRLLQRRTLLQLCVILAHELVHIRNLQTDTKDTCGQGSYHNDAFRREAEDIHLDAKPTRGTGWGNSIPTLLFRSTLLALPVDQARLDQIISFDIPTPTPPDLSRAREARKGTGAQIKALKDEIAELKDLIQTLINTPRS